jgi:hypothetical protein
MLKLLESAEDYRVPYIHKNVDTQAAFDYYIEKWTQSGHKDYPILYLAFHGTKGNIHFGDQRSPTGKISLSQLEQSLQGKCKNRILHFGSCSTLALHGNTINSFLKSTQALAVVGYEGKIDWMCSTAYDLLFFAAAQWASFTKSGLRAVKDRLEEAASHKLGESLGFRIVINPE